METLDIVLIIVEIALSLLLIIPMKLSKRFVSTKWRLCFAAPAIACMIIAGLGGFDKYMLPAYIGAAATLAGFFSENTRARIGTAAANVVLSLAVLPLCIGNEDYRGRDFTKEFEKMFPVMKKHYVLSELKGIDWDELYGRYLPMFEEADNEHSSLLNYIAWCRFTYEFHDCHVYYSDGEIDKNEKTVNEAMTEIFDILSAGDYGLSLMGLSDGRTAAVNVGSTSAAALAGIHNGTIITSWNGMTVEEAGITSPVNGVVMNFADKDNEAFWLPLQASVNGGESVTVTFIDDEGKEKSAELSRMGSGYSRYYDTYHIISQGVEAENFGFREINEDTVCFRLKSMSYDSFSARKESYANMKYEVTAELKKYLSEGKKNLIIDMRDNGGGSGLLVETLGEIFAPEGTYFYVADGKWDDKTHSYARDPETGEYMKGDEHYFSGDNTWQGNQIIILVNSGSVSAADHFTMIMRGMENVTVMGFTESAGSAQGIGAAQTDNAMLSFSNCLMLDKNGDIFIDSGADYESGNDIDIRVSFDEEAIKALFENGEDHLLNKALEHFNENG